MPALKPGVSSSGATVFVDGLHDLIRSFHGVGGDVEIIGFWTQRWLTVALIMTLALVNVLGVEDVFLVDPRPGQHLPLLGDLLVELPELPLPVVHGLHGLLPYLNLN